MADGYIPAARIAAACGLREYIFTVFDWFVPAACMLEASTSANEASCCWFGRRELLPCGESASTFMIGEMGNIMVRASKYFAAIILLDESTFT